MGAVIGTVTQSFAHHVMGAITQTLVYGTLSETVSEGYGSVTVDSTTITVDDTDITADNQSE